MFLTTLLLVDTTDTLLLIGRMCDTQMLRRICVGAYCLFCPRDTHMLREICVGAYAVTHKCYGRFAPQLKTVSLMAT